MILDYISPARILKSLNDGITDLANFNKYKDIVKELKKDGKLKELELTTDDDGNMFLGVNLNPELLLYSDTSQESVELKLIAEKMKKYTDFLTKEGILDVVTVDYERVKTEEHYGYILRIKYAFTKYRKKTMIYDASYLILLSVIALGGLIKLVSTVY